MGNLATSCSGWVAKMTHLLGQPAPALPILEIQARVKAFTSEKKVNKMLWLGELILIKAAFDCLKCLIT